MIDPLREQTEMANFKTYARKSGQPLMLQQIKTPERDDKYSVYPYHALGSGNIKTGYESLANWILQQQGKIAIDGMNGVFWKEVHNGLARAFANTEKKIQWIFTPEFFKSEEEIDLLVQPFLGEADSVWGTKCTYKLSDFFNSEQLTKAPEHTVADCVIIIGIGAALVDTNIPVIYLDVPKNEIQYRMRAGAIRNMGSEKIDNGAAMYKRTFFVDWPLLNAHKQTIMKRVAVFADVQWPETVSWAESFFINRALKEMSQTVFRVRPWFEPGAWGGQWMKEHIPSLNKNEINYAWSFELIVPENGIVFESDRNLLELSFDFIMLNNGRNVLGKNAAFFGTDFPIRFDFLDTWDGGNLSIQCHPRLQYIREHFGEHITQDETYYILDCKENAEVFLGFQDDINPNEFKNALEESKQKNIKVDIERYVQSYHANKHDLFLIPNGTVHSAGKNNLVLEISATPYIFTFKMYDWLRLDLNGEPRAINIEHAFKNLRFEYKGDYVRNRLISKPDLLNEGEDWMLYHLPTHAHHFYDIQRIEFKSEITLDTNDSCNVLMLVEGDAVQVKVNGVLQVFQYAETFVIPAAAKQYTLVNNEKGVAKVVKAFIKESIDY